MEGLMPPNKYTTAVNSNNNKINNSNNKFLSRSILKF